MKPERLQELRSAIAAGRYEVPAELVAEALLPWLVLLNDREPGAERSEEERGSG